MTDRDQNRREDEQEVAAVVQQTHSLIGAARRGDADAADALLDGAFEYLDRGFAVAAEPIIAALDELGHSGLLTSRQQGWLLNCHARLAISQQAYPEAATQLEAARVIAAAEKDRALTATTLLNLGNVSWASGQAANAVAFFERSLDARPLDDQFGRAQTYLNLAGARLESGDVVGSEEALRRAETLHPSCKGGRGYPAPDVVGEDGPFGRRPSAIAKRSVQRRGRVAAGRTRFGVAMRDLPDCGRLGESGQIGGR